MSKSKTIREWLNELPEPIRSRAIRNAENESDTLLDTVTDVNFENALWGAFIWFNTPEGHAYWGAVHDGETPELPEHLKEKGMKKYAAFDSEHGWEFFDSIEEAREFFNELLHDGVWDDRPTHEIYELKEQVVYRETDRKENYDYENEEDVPEGEDGEVWPYANDIDYVGYLEFIDVKNENQ